MKENFDLKAPNIDDESDPFVEPVISCFYHEDHDELLVVVFADSKSFSGYYPYPLLKNLPNHP
jgi:hypothetical protein